MALADFLLDRVDWVAVSMFGRAKQLELVVDDAAKPALLPCRSIRVENQRRFGEEDMRRLFVEALKPPDGHEVEFTDPISALEWAVAFCKEPAALICVAVDSQNKLRGLLICEFAQGTWSLGPWVLHYHSQSAAARDALQDGCVEWLESIGQDTIFGLNQMSDNDDLHFRFFRKRFDGAKFASLNTFTIKGS